MYRFFILLFLILFSLSSEEESEGAHFFFKQPKGLKYHILSQVDEQVKSLLPEKRPIIDKTTILNKIATNVLDKQEDYSNLSVDYQISEKSQTNDYFTWSEEFNTRFTMNERGNYFNLQTNSFQPPTKNIPVFPDTPIKIGDSWSADGEELQDLAPTFGIKQVLHIPFTAHYLYHGKKEIEGKEYDHFIISYKIDKKIGTIQESRLEEVYPNKIESQYTIDLFWDSEKGLPIYDREKFHIEYNLTDDSRYIFDGTSKSHLYLSTPMEKQRILKDIKKKLTEEKIDAQVKQTDKGLSIDLNDLYFKSNSAKLLDSQQDELKTIAKILESYPDRDIEIIGHTANIGNKEEQYELSLKRAGAIGQYLLEHSIRDQSQLIIKGVGSDNQVTNDKTKEGRQKNRRVEIIIREN